jgi:hypothetical protein
MSHQQADGISALSAINRNRYLVLPHLGKSSSMKPRVFGYVPFVCGKSDAQINRAPPRGHAGHFPNFRDGKPRPAIGGYRLRFGMGGIWSDPEFPFEAAKARFPHNRLRRTITKIRPQAYL